MKNAKPYDMIVAKQLDFLRKNDLQVAISKKDGVSFRKKIYHPCFRKWKDLYLRDGFRLDTYDQNGKIVSAIIYDTDNREVVRWKA